MRRIAVSAILAAGILGLSACVSAPTLQRVLLVAPPDGQVQSAAHQWEVRRVHTPEYLDNYDIQLRSDDYVLTRLADAKWAERLPVAITRLLQQTIDAQADVGGDQSYEVDVRIDSFEPRSSGQVVLSASWHVTHTRTGKVIARETGLVRQPLPATAQRDPAAIGRAMSAAVRELGLRIVASVG